ncbi:MAG: transposase [Chloroflexi bacterium]|nr:transposase [Chloroflexota bacterium]
MLADFDLSSIQDPGVRQAIAGLLNLVETLTVENRTLREENQRLRDEINRLKGEQGKPTFPAKAPQPPADHSSEAERRRPQGWSKGSKQDRIVVDREQVVRVDRAVLPPDAEFKGYAEQVVQDLALRSDNVLFRQEKWYSPSERKSYLAALPAGYTGQFGPGLRALTLALYYAGQMSEAKILELYRSVGVQVSDGEVSNLLVKDHEPFHVEREAVALAGLASSPWQHLDDTETRVNGQGRHCHILCNPLYTAYTTLPAKDRLSVVAVLARWEVRRFRLNAEARAYLVTVGTAQWVQAAVAGLPQDQDFEEIAFAVLLDERLPGLGPQQRRWVEDAAAVAAYHAQTAVPVVRLLVCDDAPQFKGVTDDLALCWVHEGRHYKKLVPYFAQHRQALDDFLKQFWAYYDELLVYRGAPTAADRERLDRRFTEVFTTQTGYALLDDRIAKTLAKRESLLQVLVHPELPLHNNPAELGARQRVRKRDVSFGPRTEEGARAWDTFMTLGETAKKLGVSLYHYLRDTLSGARQMPRLADLIMARTQNLKPGRLLGYRLTYPLLIEVIQSTLSWQRSDPSHRPGHPASRSYQWRRCWHW